MYCVLIHMYKDAPHVVWCICIHVVRMYLCGAYVLMWCLCIDVVHMYSCVLMWRMRLDVVPVQ